MIKFNSLGRAPAKEYEGLLRISPQFDSLTKTFFNENPFVLKEMRKRAFDLNLVKEWLLENNKRLPSRELPFEIPDISKFLAPHNGFKVIWFGHSSLLLNMNGKIILVDPVFSLNASPTKYLARRFQAPPLSLQELPTIDYILISHDHYDHLDMEVIKFFKDKMCEFICPLGVGSHLISWGISKERIIEKDWWKFHQVSTLKFTATPAQHFSGRNGFDQNKTLWSSWVIENENHRIFFSGDSGHNDHFKTIRKKFGEFDLAFIETGQYHERWREIHMLPHESIRAFHDLNAKKYFPIHWGMFTLAFHTWSEPIEILYKEALEKNLPLIAPKLGQIYVSSENQYLTPWWRGTN